MISLNPLPKVKPGCEWLGKDSAFFSVVSIKFLFLFFFPSSTGLEIIHSIYLLYWLIFTFQKAHLMLSKMNQYLSLPPIRY